MQKLQRYWAKALEWDTWTGVFLPLSHPRTFYFPDKLISGSEPGNILCFHEKMTHVKSYNKIPPLDCHQHTLILRCTRSTRVIYVTLHLLHAQMLTQDVRQGSHINNGGCTKDNLKVSSSISWSDFWFKSVFKLQKLEPNVEITLKK